MSAEHRVSRTPGAGCGPLRRGNGGKHAHAAVPGARAQARPFARLLVRTALLAVAIGGLFAFGREIAQELPQLLAWVRAQGAWAPLVFVAAYALGVVAAVLSALLARRTILKGAGRAMAMELPAYKRPSLTLAAKTSAVRGWFFLRSAGTNILAISLVLWWLSAYPRAQTPEADALAARAVEVTTALPDEPVARASAEAEAASLKAEATRLHDRHQARHSYIGRIGDFAQPVFAPLGFDRQLTVGVMASFAAREVFASTMSIVTTGEGDWEGALDKLARAQRDDGGPIFTRAASWSLLVYYVLAMQCLPTLAVTDGLALPGNHLVFAMTATAIFLPVRSRGAVSPPSRFG